MRVTRQIGRRIVTTDDDRINWRQVVPRHVDRVGGVAIREEQDAGQRQAAESARNRIERRLQRAAFAVELERGEIVDRSELRVEPESASVEIVAESPLPARIGIQ